MNEPTLWARVEREEDGALGVHAPRIGWWCDPPERGALLGPGSSIGALCVLNRRYRIVLPDGVAGHVAPGVTRHRVLAVEHGQLLFRLLPAVLDPASQGGRPEHGGAEDHGELPPGARAIVAPTDGVFYSRPAPGAAPFVHAGQRLRRGQAVGLVEVMKTFNEIVYDGPGADEVEVLEVRGAEAREVRAGEVLVVVRPAAAAAGLAEGESPADGPLDG